MAQIPQGRQDWQRTGGADSQLLIADSTFVVNTGPVTFGPFNVAGFWSLEGMIQVASGGYVRFDVSYYADQARTQLMSTRRLAVDSAGSNVVQIFTPALGPWVTIVATPVTGATVWSAKTVIAATTRLSRGLTSLNDGLMASVQAVAIGATVALTTQLAAVHAGPALLAVAANAANIFWYVQAQRAAGVWDYVFQRVDAGGALFSQAFVLPPYPCRFVISNNSAGAFTAYGMIVASLTGSD